MNTLAIAYGLACSVIGAYVVWMSFQQRRLTRRIEVLNSLTQGIDVSKTTRRAA